MSCKPLHESCVTVGAAVLATDIRINSVYYETKENIELNPLERKKSIRKKSIAKRGPGYKSCGYDFFNINESEITKEIKDIKSILSPEKLFDDAINIY